MLDKKIIPEFVITYNCNMNCEYCYAKIEQKNFGEEMQSNTFTSIINDLEYAVKSVFNEKMDEITLLGGEPTMHSQLAYLIEQACDKGIKVNLFTNGIYSPDLLNPVLSLQNFHALFFHYEPIFLPLRFKDTFLKKHRECIYFR